MESVIANCNRDSSKKAEPFQPADFMPAAFQREARVIEAEQPHEPTEAEMNAFMSEFSRKLGAKKARDN